MVGKFITFEGCDGAGKSTQVFLLKEYLRKRGVPVFFTREPGGTEISEQIRSVILSSKNKEMDPVTELMLYCASRRQLTSTVIARHLSAGEIVICDRYIDSTAAYQGYGRGLDIEMINRLNSWAVGSVAIDVTIFLDVDPQSGFSRKGGADRSDRLESEAPDFYSRVYQGFNNIADRNPERIVRVDGTGTSAGIHKNIVEILRERKIVD